MTKRYHLIQRENNNGTIIIWHLFLKDNVVHNFIQTYKNSHKYQRMKHIINISLKDLHKEEYFSTRISNLTYPDIRTYISMLDSIGRLDGFIDALDVTAKITLKHHDYARVVGCSRKGTLRYEILLELLFECRRTKYYKKLN